MQFFKYISLLALPILAAATPNPGAAGGVPTTTVSIPPLPTGTQPASQCNTEKLQCCDSVQQSDSSSVSTLLGLLGVVLQGVAVPVGLTCNPITVIGAGNAGW